jgi:O-antigen/teichoic acid export membrane protein
MINLSANYAGQFWVALMGIAFVPTYIRLIGIESYGLIGLFVLMQSMFTLLDLGLGPAIGREASKFKAGVLSLQTIIDTLRSIEWVLSRFVRQSRL